MASASNIFAGIGGTGVVACSAAVVLYSKEQKFTPLIVATGLSGVVLSLLGFSKKSVPRGRAGCDLEKQSFFLSGTSSFAKAKDEDGSEISVYCGEKAVLGLPLSEFAGVLGKPAKPLKDEKLGLIMSISEDIKTTYDLIFQGSHNDARPALGRCKKLHTFKDEMRDGKPNPKPSVVDKPGEWATISYAEMKQQARAFGSYIRGRFGIGQTEKVAIWAGNCVEWLLADLACCAYNWTSVSVYDTLGPDAASFIVADAGAQVLVVEERCLKKALLLLDDEVYKSNAGADLKVIVCIGAGDADTKKAIEKKGLAFVTFEDALRCDKLLPDTKPTSEDIVTIMYTSGTTGNPKGVMLSHLNIVSTISMMDLNPSLDLFPTDVHLSYLPLAHIFERQNVMALLFKGATVYFASQGAKFLLADLSVIRPTIFAGVPKVYENVRDAVSRKMQGFKKTLFEAALAAKIQDIETGCGYHPIWDLLIFKKTQKALGGRVRFCVTGGAPISKDTLHFVMCALAPVVQGYGATETSAASTLTMSFDLVAGSVGAPLGTAAIRLVDVPDMNYYSGPRDQYSDSKAKKCFAAKKDKWGGEVWIGGPGVSNGYYDPAVNGIKKGLPSNSMATKTKDDFFTEDGWSWFKTGDIGSFNERGCLRIVDRKKNMFKTSLGEYVPVEEVEKTYQDTCPYADFVFLPKETKVAYVAVCVIVSDSIGVVMKWAKQNGVAGDENTVVGSDAFRELLFLEFEKSAKAKKLQRFLWVRKENIHAEYQLPGYQEAWVDGVMCKNGHKEQLLTATFKPRRAQLDQYFAPIFPKLYPDRPADHILP
eukprot:TRINITY_DN15774_c0_g1_i1.p1 TRINITY_DN15774_c0_g1~~TRINITY_DN15774_c0_g1_i1.p1  ORF type:complete len:828 (+),score=111.33 TRINITY_DN15774_c0_g1_i1:28-2484(+)